MKKRKGVLLTLVAVALALGMTLAISACEGELPTSDSQTSEGSFSTSDTQTSEGSFSTSDSQTSEDILSTSDTQTSEDILSTSDTQTSEDILSTSDTQTSGEASLFDSSSEEHVHVWSEWQLVKEASCSERGEQHRTCLIDPSHVETEYLDVTGHNLAGYGAKEPTCVEVGWKDYEACLNCSYSTYVEIPATGQHDVTDAKWKSTDNVTMTAKCNNCDAQIVKDVLACDHFLSLNAHIGENGAVVSEEIYTCEYCALTFEPYDVITLTFSDAEEEGYYRMTISSKIAHAEYDFFGILYKPVEVKIENGCSFSYEHECWENKNKIREVVIGENITVVGAIDCYEYVYTLIFGEQVEKIKTNATCDLFSLKEIYFEGDLPELEPDALWRRGSAVEGEEYNNFSPIVYYKQGAEGFEEYGYKLQGCGLRRIGEEVKAAPAWTMTEYAAKTNARSLEMATEWFERAAKTRPYLQFYPFCELSKYKPIKDLALSLTEGLSTDREKAKAIFDWIVENITYDEGAMYSPIEKVFEEKKAVCAGYAGLMHDMLAAVEIPSLYTAGISYFGTECSVQDILNNEESKYVGKGHGWVICLLDGEAVICDPTWGNFAFSAEEFTELCLATTRLNGVSVIPEDFDPALYKNLLYYDDGEVYYLNDGYLKESDQYGVIVNFVYYFNYEFRTGNDGYDYGKGILDCKSAYSDLLMCYGEHNYKYYFFFGADYLRYNYVEILKFVAFEKFWYGNQIELEHLEEFLLDDYGTIYHINEENELSVAGTVAEGDTLVIPETVNGLKVTAIDDNALQGCYAREIILPDSIEKIGAQAFLSCINLESLVLPKNLKHIEPGAFAHCYSLKSVTMYTSVEFIGYKDNHRLSIPSLLFDDIAPEQLTVYYQGTEEEFNKIYFNNPFANPEELTFDTEQYEHVKGYVAFKE